MANPGRTPTSDESKVTRAAIRAAGLLALAREAGVNETTAARVAAEAPVIRSNIAAVVRAAERLVALSPDAGLASPAEPLHAA